MKQTFSQIMDQIKYEKPIIPYLTTRKKNSITSISREWLFVITLQWL